MALQGAMSQVSKAISASIFHPALGADIGNPSTAEAGLLSAGIRERNHAKNRGRRPDTLSNFSPVRNF
jgi:hypothetical protein